MISQQKLDRSALSVMRQHTELKAKAVVEMLDALDRLEGKNADGQPLSADDWTELENLRP